MSHLTLPIQAATRTAIAHGISPDRCEVLQDGSTLVLRLTDTLVARIIRDVDGPRQGDSWFKRENAVACHLAERGAPVIPMHPDIPPGPHESSGHTLNFWRFVTVIDQEPPPSEIGRTLLHCHRLLAEFPVDLPELAILKESLGLLPALEKSGAFSHTDAILLRDRLVASTKALEGRPFQPLHGDAHPGNLLNTTDGLLWTDWEDTFNGPVEWDLASILWNARILDEDHAMAEGILAGYVNAGGSVDEEILGHCMVARAAVMSIWYPILYPDAGTERTAKLQRRLDWLRTGSTEKQQA